MTFAGALALLAVLGHFYAVPLMAQVRAALIKNIDEKGRIPYVQNNFNLSCTSALCDVAFTTVPTGKRLVIEHVNCDLNPSAGVNGVFLEGDGGFGFAFAGNSMADPHQIFVNQPVLAYFEAGQTPFIRVAFSTTSNPGGYTASISGYLVDLTQ